MAANPFKDLRVFYDGLGRTAVSWILDSRFDDPYPHSFELHFSASSTGFNSNDYEIIALGDKVSYLRDNVFRTAGFSGSAYYRVKLTTPGGTYMSSTKGYDGNVDKKNIGVLRELLRKESLAMRKDRGGVTGYLFKRRYYGPRCVCTDKNTNTLVSTSCIACAGTGFKDGYFPGVEFPILISSAETSQAQISEVGSADLRAFEARCLAFPTADAKDIWLERDTSRAYEIKKYSIISRYSLEPVAAQIELRELPLADTVALIVSSLRDFALPLDSQAANVYSAPIIIAEEPKIGTADSAVTEAGVVEGADNPFAQLLQASTTPADKDKTPPIVVVKEPSKPTTTTSTTTIVNPVAPSLSDSLDGGLY